MNDNHCVKFLLSRRLAGSKQTLDFCQASCKFCRISCCYSCTYCKKAASKESRLFVKQHQSLKYVNSVSCIDQLCSVKCLRCCTKSACRGQTESVLGNLASPGGRAKGCTNVKRVPFHTTLILSRSPRDISCYVNPHRNLDLLEALHQLTNKNAVELVKNQEYLGFYSRLFLVPKPNNKWRPTLNLSNLNKFLKMEKLKRETPDLPTNRGVGDVHRLQGCLLPYTHSKPIDKTFQISCTGQNIPVQSTSIWSVHISLRVHYCDQRGHSDGVAEGYKNPPVPKQLVDLDQIRQICLQHTQTLVALCQDLGWLVNMEKLELDPKQVFDFVGYQFDLREGKIRHT